MGRKKHQSEYYGFRGVGGFTLIELLVGIALTSVIVIFLYEFLTSQNRTYSLQDDIAEMQQSLRVAVERISRDMMMAGLGKPAWSTINGVSASAWYNSTNNYTSYNITASGGNNAIDIVGCIDGTVSRLAANAAVGATAISVNSGEGSNFNTTTAQDINIGAAENAKTTAVSGDTLTIDIDPSSGGNQGLQSAAPANSVVCLVKWVTYGVDADNNLTINTHQGAGNQPVAQNITGMTLSITGKLLTISLTGRTRNPDRSTGQYITTQVTNKVLLRN